MDAATWLQEAAENQEVQTAVEVRHFQGRVSRLDSVQASALAALPDKLTGLYATVQAVRVEVSPFQGYVV